MSQPLVVSELTKSYGALKAVDQVSFKIEPGQIYGLLGPNGAGKTTIISCIVGAEDCDSGFVDVFGKSVSPKNLRLIKQDIGFVPQEIINHGFFNVEEILQFYSGYFGLRNNNEKIDLLLHDLHLYEHRHKKVKQLSGGMKRRLLIAKALVHSPKLVILDEPTAGVDVALRHSLWNMVEKLKEAGVAILLTTHYLDEAEKLCDQVTLINNGKVRAEGPTAGLIEKLTQRVVSIQYGGDSSHIDHQYLTEKESGILTFRMPSSVPIGKLLSDVQFELSSIIDIRISEGSLEDVFTFVLKEGESL